MAQKKKQHYVPRFYLRYFSVNSGKTHIGLFHFETGKLVLQASLKNQGYADYFYGKDLEVEESLAIIERKASCALDWVIQNKALPQYQSDTYKEIWTFALLQKSRTKRGARETNESINATLKAALKEDSRFNELEDLEFFIQETPLFNIGILMDSMKVAEDLACKLIVNKTNTPFITSDHPVVKYNQFLEKRKFPAGKEGLATKGLQIFYPISPKLTLIFYDSRVYKIGTKKDRTVETNSLDDINSLNLLQALNCDEVVYFNGSFTEFQMQKLVEKRGKVFMDDQHQINESPEVTQPDGTVSKLMHMFTRGYDINLKLSFVKESDHAKAYVLTGYAAELRDERWRDYRFNRQKE